MYFSISVEHTKYIVQYSYYIILCYTNIKSFFETI